MEHYLLCVTSIIARGEKEIVFESMGSANARTIDLANLVAKLILPGEFEVQPPVIEVRKEGKYRVSYLSITLGPKRK